MPKFFIEHPVFAWVVAILISLSGVIAILNLITVTVLGAVVAGIYNLAVKITGGLLVGFTSN